MKKLLLILFSLLIIAPVFAFNIRISPVDSSVKPGEMIEYNIILDNDASNPRTVVMYMISEKLNPSFNPGYQITVPANDDVTVVMKATVSETATPGRYYDSIFFEIGGVIPSPQTISYTVEGPEQYFNFNNISVPSQVDPRNDFNVTLGFENGYSELIERVYATVEIYSEDGTSLYYSLKVLDTPLGDSVVNIPVNVPSNLPPTIANARVSIDWYNTNFGSKISQFSIIGYVENNTEQLDNTNIITSTNGIMIENNGTLVIPSFDYEVPINNFDLLFITGASVDYSITGNSIVFHVPDIYPGEYVNLYYEVNYAVLYILPFLIFGLIYLFFFFTKKISVKREIFEFKSGTNTVSFKVVLNITNISKDVINRVRVRESIPLIISEVFDFGTLKGSIKSSNSKKFIEWNLGKMKPGENIILSYKMRSKIGFIGELSLDKSVVEILDAEGRVQNTTRTNTVLIDVTPKK